MWRILSTTLQVLGFKLNFKLQLEAALPFTSHWSLKCSSDLEFINVTFRIGSSSHPLALKMHLKQRSNKVKSTSRSSYSFPFASQREICKLFTVYLLMQPSNNTLLPHTLVPAPGPPPSRLPFCKNALSESRSLHFSSDVVAAVCCDCRCLCCCLCRCCCKKMQTAAIKY